MELEKLKDFFGADRFAADSGIVIESVAEGRAVAYLDIQPRHLNAGGVCQGGAIFTLADTAMAVAANTRGKLTLSVQSNIMFLSSAAKGRITATAVEVTDHRKLPSYEVTITDDNGNTIAKVTGLCYRKETELK